MRFLFIIPSITNYYTFLEDITAHLETQGHEVHIASSATHISEIDCYDRSVNGILHEVDFPRRFEFARHRVAARRLQEIVVQVRPDIINVHFSAGMFTTALAKKSDWPYTIAMIHGLAYPILGGWRKAVIGAAERWASKRMDHIVVINQVDADKIKDNDIASRVTVLDSYGLGCDLDRFHKDRISEATKLLYHRRLNVRKDDFVYIFVGRQVHFKGFDKLIRAFISLYGEHKNLKLLLIGDRDSIHRTNLDEKEEQALKDCPGIIQVGWKDNVHEYLTVADVNVFPSLREGMPVNLMESLAMGIPVITTDSRGCNEVVEHDMNGILLKKDSVNHIRAAMMDLYEDREKLQRLSTNALHTRERFDRKKFIVEMIRIFEQAEQNPAHKPATA